MENKITIRHLEAFRAMMVRRSVTGAADMLDVTQPVVTRLIAEFEDRISLKLFDRVKGRLHPTPEAMLMLDDVHKTLDSIERIATISSNISSLQLPHLKIAAAPAMAISFLPKTITQFMQDYPNTKISLHTYSTSSVVDLVQSGQCDLGFGMLNLRHNNLNNIELLMNASMVAVVPKTHHLAQRKSLHPEDFEGESFISLDQSVEVRSKIDALMLNHRVRRKMKAETQLSSVMIQLVEAGAGVSLIEPLTASAYKSDSIQFIPFEPAINVNYALMISPRLSSSILLKPFIDQVRRDIARMLPKKFYVAE